MSIQEVGTMIKKGVTPYLFVINNDGWVPRKPDIICTDAA